MSLYSNFLTFDTIDILTKLYVGLFMCCECVWRMGWGGRCCSVPCRLFSSISSVQGGSLVAQRVKNLPVMQETRVQSLGQETPLETGKVTEPRCPVLQVDSLVSESPGN